MRTPWGMTGGGGGADTSLQGDYPPGDITPTLGGGFMPGGQDPNQIPNFQLPPWLVPWIYGGGGGGPIGTRPGVTLPPLQGVPPPPSTSQFPAGGTNTPTNQGIPSPTAGAQGPGINWQTTLGDLGKAIQGGIQGAQGPRGGGGSGGGGGGQGGSQGRVSAAPSPVAPPHMSLIAPMPPPLQLPQIPQYSGAFAAGGIVPQTGLYEVQGGEQVIPRKKVAKLHKGELVLPSSTRQQATLASLGAGASPQFVGSFQEGTSNIPGATPPIAPDPHETAQNVKKVLEGMAKSLGGDKSKAQDTTQAETGGGGGTASGAATVSTPPTPVAPPQMDLSGLLRQMIQQQAQAGAPPYVPQQMPHIPGISPGAPTSTGPSQYATPSALPPYQSQFAPRARAQYVTQNLVGGLNNAVQQYNQRRWDKKSAEAQKDILDSLYERAGMTPPGGNIQPQTAQVGGGAATGTPSTPAGGGVGASRMAGQMPAMQAQGPPTVLQQLQQAYNQEQDPKQKERLAKTIQQRQKWEEQRAGRIAQAVSKAQTDPMSPEYNGAMKAYGIFQAQLTAQNEAQQKAAEIQAAQAQAKAREMQAIGETAKAAAEQQKLTTLTPYQQAYIGVLRNRDANVDLRNRAWYQVGVQRNLISDRNNARLYNAYIQRANAGDKDAQELVNMINTANKENEGYQRAINDAQQNVAKETKNLQDAKGKVGLGYLFSRDDIKAIRDRINTYNNQAKALQDKINANQKRVDDLKRQQDLAAMSMGQRAQAPLQLLPLPDLPPMPNYDALPDLPGAGGDTNLTAPSLTAPSGEAGDGSVDKPIDMRQ